MRRGRRIYTQPDKICGFSDGIGKRFSVDCISQQNGSEEITGSRTGFAVTACLTGENRQTVGCFLSTIIENLSFVGDSRNDSSGGTHTQQLFHQFIQKIRLIGFRLPGCVG